MMLKKLNIRKAEEFVSKIIVVIEDINRLQVEKDSLINSYPRIKKSFEDGNISLDVFKATIDKMNSELEIIDSLIKEQVNLSLFSVDSISDYIKNQKPVRIRLVAEKQ